MLNPIYQIGDVIKWKVGSVPAVGIVYDDCGEEEIEVQCVEVNGRVCRTKLKIKRDCIIRE